MSIYFKDLRTAFGRTLFESLMQSSLPFPNAVPLFWPGKLLEKVLDVPTCPSAIPCPRLGGEAPNSTNFQIAKNNPHNSQMFEPSSMQTRGVSASPPTTIRHEHLFHQSENLIFTSEPLFYTGPCKDNNRSLGANSLSLQIEITCMTAGLVLTKFQGEPTQVFPPLRKKEP